MSILGLARQSTSFNEYDHEIVLVDETKPKPVQSSTGESAQSESPPLSPRNSQGRLSKRWTLREELAKRKLARWSTSQRPEDETTVSDEAQIDTKDANNSAKPIEESPALP